ncbi:GNAT family N-acetyltransferase [Nonomuraea salmonea]|uniref:GNAT family N-acetyltransferase n=2 Tax=Nonomuraea salmonea TaxID=46181 RepID=A0ABV5NI15_9ACTN
MTPDLEPHLANCRDYWLGWGAAARSGGALAYYRSDIAHSQLNGVLRAQDPGRVRQAAEAMGDVPWLWWVGPDSAGGIADELVRHGAELAGAMPIMAVDLDRLAPVEQPAGLEIAPVDALEEWVNAYGPSFGVTGDLIDEAVRNESARTDDARIVRLVGRIDGRAVGTALLYDAHGVAGVYVVATAEPYRRRGIGAALTAAALQAGRERGLAIGTLQASGMGAPVYRRMGFVEVGEYRLFSPPPRTG